MGAGDMGAEWWMPFQGLPWSEASHLLDCPTTFAPSLPQGSPGVKGAPGPMGPPGTSVSGPPVRVLSVCHAGGIAGAKDVAAGKRAQGCLCLSHQYGTWEERGRSLAQPQRR